MNIKKIILISTIVFTIATSFFSTTVFSVNNPVNNNVIKSSPDITCKTAVLIDATTGGVLYNKEMHTQMYPASITKILTGIVAIKLGKPQDIITVSKNVTDIITHDYASIALSDGEQITQEQALYAMFLASANDAALALAEHNGGTTENFVDLMNKEATKDGALNSHFNNPDGLPDPNNLTSAYDMAMITKSAIVIPELMKYLSAFTFTISPTNLQPEARGLWTLHKMMKDTVFYDKDVIAGKTGWETMSGHTLVTVAQRGNIKLICVAMKSQTPYSIYNDTKLMLNYGFDNYSTIKQSFVEKPKVVVTTKQINTNKYDTNTKISSSIFTRNKIFFLGFLILMIAIIGILSFFKIRKSVYENASTQ
jgi:D-alanyl-D-alanine carboxypeptidase (penicillin-binding protein 5/6)